MKASRFVLTVATGVLAVAATAGATKYYFNGFNSSSLSGWTAQSGDGSPDAGVYRWPGGEFGYEMVGYDPAAAANKGAYTAATPVNPVGQDFWMSADFMHMGDYRGFGNGMGTGTKRTYQFYVDATGAGMGVYASMSRADGTIDLGLCYTGNYYGLTTSDAISLGGASSTWDNTKYQQLRVDVNFRSTAGLIDIYLDHNLVGTRQMSDLAGLPAASTVQNFTAVGAYFRQTFDEQNWFSTVSIDNLWCGSEASPFVVAHPGFGPPYSLIQFGDFNCDGIVDVVDLGLMAGSWKKGNATWAGSPLSRYKNPGMPIWPWMLPGDSNGDGTVDVVDLGILATNWKKSVTLPPEPTPEPATMALLSLDGLAMLRRRNK